jgi:hypothetical protein
MTQESEKLLTDIYNAFDPFNPLPAGALQYVDSQETRGHQNIIRELGTRILRSQRMTYQLYAGHRGAGKSTELLRLQEYLQNQGCFVVYFAADEQDINPEDTEYTDILLACTRHLLESLTNANSKPLRDWMRDRWEVLKDLALTEVSFETLSLESQIAQFDKLTANVRTVPSLRQKIREKINPQVKPLIEALNEFIDDAKKMLPDRYSKLVLIVDNLDRIVPFTQEWGRSNLDEIFLDRSELLKSLDCHVIYTIPISMVYSNRCTALINNYDNNIQVLPMIMVQNPDGSINEAGLTNIKEVIKKRVKQVNPNLSLKTGLFDSRETLEYLCLMSGGHIRNLLLMMQGAITRTEDLPITAKAVQRAITQARDVYRRTVEEVEWQILVKVSQTHQILNDQQHRNLLFSRCILEYQYYDEEGESILWYDVHPLIKGIKQFKDCLAQLQP